MCDALISTLLYLDETPQDLETILSNTDLTPDRVSWHLDIFQDWNFTAQTRALHHLTPHGAHLVTELRKLLRGQADLNLEAPELIVLSCSGISPCTPNQITRTARTHYHEHPDDLRNTKRALQHLLANELLESCLLDQHTRALYRRTRDGQRAVREAIERWQTLERYLPSRTGTLLTQALADRITQGTLIQAR